MMKTSINEFIKNNLKVKVLYEGEDSLMKHMMTSSRLPHIVCSDGFEMSVQVGYSLYSEPKKVAKRYSKVEVGYPSDHEPLIEKWAENLFEDMPDFTDTVYPYVPVKVVNQVLKKHGGIDLTETLRRSDGLPKEAA
jgi:hypothetical protein